MILFALCFVSVLCATTSSLMAANTVTIALYYGKSFTSVALLTGYHLCGVGVAGVLIVPTARVWGKRHLFILGNILMVVSCAWAGGSGQNYQSLLWSRIIQGVALAPFEALTNACVGDLYFVHVGSFGVTSRMSTDRHDRNGASGWPYRMLPSLAPPSSHRFWLARSRIRLVGNGHFT